MSLTVNHPETHRLAQRLADMTGETLTEAVTVAVRERLERVQGEATTNLVDRMLAIGRDCASRLPEPFRSADHAPLLYDDPQSPSI